jgi:hypothetical protein
MWQIEVSDKADKTLLQWTSRSANGSFAFFANELRIIPIHQNLRSTSGRLSRVASLSPWKLPGELRDSTR